MAENMPFDVRLQRISEFFEKNDYKGEYKRSLKSLIDDGFTITDECFEKIKNDTNIPLIVDLFEGDNLIIALKKVIDFYKDPDVENKNNFIFREILGSINFKTSLNEKFSKVLEILNEKEEADEKSDPYFEKLCKIRKSLKEICSFIEGNNSTTIYNSLAKFINGVVKITNTIEASVIAAKILEESREEIENELIKTGVHKTKSLKKDIPTVPGICNAEIGASYEFKKDEGSDSLYQISRKGGVSFGLNFGIPSKIVALSASISGEMAYDSLFFSIEQMLDAEKLEKEDIQGCVDEGLFVSLLDSRKKLQQKEEKLLSIFSNDIEDFLKMLKVIPIDVHVRWPRITRADGAISGISGSLAAALSLEIEFAIDAGFEVKPSYTNTVYQKSCTFLSLLSDDCSPVDNLSVKDIKNVIKVNNKIYGSLIKKQLKDDKNLNQKILFMTYLILGELRNYISILKSLSKLNKKSKDKKNLEKSLTELKHKHENELGVKGRLNVFKTYILLSVVLSDMVKNNKISTESELKAGEEANSLFKKMFIELENLSLLLEFSKDKKSVAGRFTHSSEHLHDLGISATLALGSIFPVDFLNKFSISFAWNYHKILGGPFLDKNGRYITYELKVPFSLVNKEEFSIAMYKIIEKINGFDKKNEKSLNFSKIMSNFLKEASSMAPKVVNNIVKNSSLSDIATLGSMTISRSFMEIEKTNNDSLDKIKPLPGLESVIFKRSKSTFKKNYTRYLSRMLGGRIMIIRHLSSKTLGYVASRFNAWQIGIADKDSMSTLWNSLKSKNEKVFKKIINNIGCNYTENEVIKEKVIKEEKKSNLLYELQCIYNDILENENINDSVKNEINEVFGELLESCKNFSKNKDQSDETLNTILAKALDNLDHVLMLNYKYNFKAHFDKSFSLHK
ncbi:MAG: hypothetical protein LBH49_00495 [Puniceicoccales bacterium]|jgi:hypothetical protein|nr:hypothetical protein [Puniceicoccales bacterium]